MKNKPANRELVIYDEGQITFKINNRGNLDIEIFQQNALRQELSRGEMKHLVKFLLDELLLLDQLGEP